MDRVGVTTLGVLARGSSYILPFVALEATCRAPIAYRKQEKFIQHIALAALAGGCLVIRFQPLSAGALVALGIYAYWKKETTPYISLKILNNTAFGLKRWAVTIVFSSISTIIESIKAIVKAVLKHMVWGSVKVFAKDICWGNFQIIWKDAIFPGLQSKYQVPIGGALAISSFIVAFRALPWMFSATVYMGASLCGKGVSLVTYHSFQKK